MQAMAASDWHHITTMTGWTIHVPASARGSARLRGVSHRCRPPAGHRIRDDGWPWRMGEGRSPLCLRVAACVPERVMRHGRPRDQNGENLFITGGVLNGYCQCKAAAYKMARVQGCRPRRGTEKAGSSSCLRSSSSRATTLDPGHHIRSCLTPKVASAQHKAIAVLSKRMPAPPVPPASQGGFLPSLLRS